MKKVLSIFLFLSLNFSADAIQQAKYSARNEIKKDAKEVAGDAKQIWHGVKSDGRNIGHKSKKFVKTIGNGAKDIAKDTRK